MKRTIALILSMLMLISFLTCATAENNLGVSTQTLLAMYEGYFQSFGINTYPLTLKEEEKADKSVVKAIAHGFTLCVYQDDGMATEVNVLVNKKDAPDDYPYYAIAAAMGSLMIMDLDMSAETAMDYADRMFRGETITNKGIDYYFSFSSFINIGAVYVTVAE